MVVKSKAERSMVEKSQAAPPEVKLLKNCVTNLNLKNSCHKAVCLCEFTLSNVIIRQKPCPLNIV